jgi:endonuclease/exonuclease/phosphatase (EEP) superfamily protein YafD
MDQEDLCAYLSRHGHSLNLLFYNAKLSQKNHEDRLRLQIQKDTADIIVARVTQKLDNMKLRLDSSQRKAVTAIQERDAEIELQKWFLAGGVLAGGLAGVGLAKAGYCSVQ